MATIDGTIVQDNWIDANQPTKNWNGELSFERIGDQGGGDGARILARFTMPSDPGGGVVITDVAIIFRAVSNPTAGHPISLYHGTSTPCTTWSETTSTWNVYSTGNSWTTGGATSDFSSTIVDTYTTTGSESGTDVTWYIYGSNATNPITVTWGDTVNIMLRNDDAYSALQLDITKDEGTNKGIIRVTYGAAPSTNSNFFAFM